MTFVFDSQNDLALGSWSNTYPGTNARSSKACCAWEKQGHLLCHRGYAPLRRVRRAVYMGVLLSGEPAGDVLWDLQPNLDLSKRKQPPIQRVSSDLGRAASGERQGQGLCYAGLHTLLWQLPRYSHLQCRGSSVSTSIPFVIDNAEVPLLGERHKLHQHRGCDSGCQFHTSTSTIFGKRAVRDPQSVDFVKPNRDCQLSLRVAGSSPLFSL